MPLDPDVQKIVDDAVKTAVADAVAQIKVPFDAALDGLSKSKDAILAEKKALEAADRKRIQDADTAQALRAADKFLNGNSSPSIPEGVIRADEKSLFVNRTTVKDPLEYRRLKAVAEEQNLSLRIVDDQMSEIEDVQPRAHKFEHKGTTFLSSHYIEEQLGGPDGYRRLREQNPGQKFHAFRDLDGISDEVRAAHDAAMEVGDG